MIKTVTIWRESVYFNNFKCNKCGTKLADDNGNFLEGKLEANLFDVIRCAKCHNLVARFEEMEIPENMEGKQGSYVEFKRRFKNDNN